ncbi:MULTISPECIES: 4-hydroxybenzoate octaprenyltransferase [Rhizobium]|jgi:4-hydroxybenzoate polyprenyltransferase|uniref:4-hydroxybenzoate octaprenyltransferase n=1 Tax=Rhizobium TaxID=379 RepID=UPI00055C86CE|nr:MULTISPECIES: 4-hydroxybenzoate octaprenyltransferase [Rhizobium]NKJ06855.1 4-hydroxybenzoate polyprenyltransferase [Rhizobium sp. SG741]NTJ06186.1 4-hydroxybenzoate octaprenyltransferase [Rhizobium lusitanum]
MQKTGDINGRVADAPSGNWVYRVLPPVLWPYAQLARWDRPIGWQLLMWPCFWSVALAANASISMGHGSPGFVVIYHLILYFVGAVAMRGAGCAYNDLVDHGIDMKVARTRSRPLPSGRVTRFQTKVFIALQALAGLLVLLQFNWFAVLLGVLSLAIVALYPFAKRFTDWPQFFLGLAFSWGALMGWAGLFGSLSLAPIVLYAAAILWTIGYDTIYAHQDKEDDELIGVRSTARLFGDQTRLWLIGLYGATVLLMLVAFALAGAGWLSYVGLIVAGGMFAYQIAVLDIKDGEQCRALFLSNNRVGLIVFAGLFLSFLLLVP